MLFDKDGNLIVPKSTKITKDTEYLWIIKSLKEIPFPVGKNLLIDYMIGNTKNESIIKCKLNKLKTFGCLGYSKEELDGIISRLLINKLIVQVPALKNKFWKVLEVTDAGYNELDNPTLNKSVTISNHENVEITLQEKETFKAFGKALEGYNDYQKKSIICNNDKILCIAGAGSGKTTVLTKRIEFLIKYKSVNPSEILAITFTRKARQEMEKRLFENQIYGVNIQTFNSFCEKFLKQYNNQVYGKEMQVLSYRDKIVLINRALSEIGMNISSAINVYFTFSQRRGKTNEQLVNIFRADCFFIRDYLKFKNQSSDDISFKDLNYEHKKSAELVFNVCNLIDKYMQEQGLRDFADQLIDTVKFFKIRKDLIPQYSHVLIDEFQDVNATQIELIELIHPENLFCVGDPRQSIFGWRGSNIKYILEFKQKYPKCEIINLTKNYRSTKHIVELINQTIKPMNLPDLETDKEGDKNISLLGFKNEDSEFLFIADRITNLDIPRNEIFVLARTNKLLNKISEFFNIRNIKHILRSEETNNKNYDNIDSEKITLATIHAIKGLEAKVVFIAGANTNNFPCRGNEHPIIELVKIEEYDKEEEERRLFYVALSRAKDYLYVTYTGSMSYFISSKMIELFSMNKYSVKKQIVTGKNLNGISLDVVSRLKKWRYESSKNQGIPAYMIMHDTTLEAIAQRMPMTLSDLEDVPGLGPVKIQKYGDEILENVL
ncbi:MAG: UvrD-helicase domain-containing protein [Candidatus Woesearchaeota archaeon]